MWELIASDGTRYPLTAGITTIGREGCDILLADARVSRQHAQIVLRGDIPYITDLNSSNGTFVNGQRVYTDHPLRPGDAIQMGNTRLIVSGPGGAPPTTLMSGETVLMGGPSPGPAPAAPRTPSPMSSPGPTSQADAVQIAGKIGLFGGHGLITVGALMVLFAFILPWASCSGVQVSGLDIATNPTNYTDNSSGAVLILVPLGALLLIALSVVNVILILLGKKLPPFLGRLVLFLPVLGVIPGLCGCCPTGAFFLRIQQIRSDPESMGLGQLVRLESGFWLTLLGLAIVFAGILVALAGALADLFVRRKASAVKSSGP